jgi:hypothetical protein
MKRHIGTIAALLLIGSVGAQAADDTNKVTPGTAPTGAVGDQVPSMKGECATDAQVDTKAPGTEATEAMGSEVPTMKQADASADCAGKANTGTTKTE